MCALKKLCGSVLAAAVVGLFPDRSSGNSRSNWKNSVNDVRKRSWRPSRKKINMNTVPSLPMKLSGS
jgi:hypothetical protein